MRITSQEGIDCIKRFEGFSATPYEDVVGKLTIGYGHLIMPGECFAVLSYDEAEGLLRRDLGQAEKAVTDLVTQPLSDNEFDALVSFTFNLGRNALRDSTLLRMVNAGNMEAAADQFLRWNHAGGKVVAGLTRRRQAERSLFLHG